MADYYSWKTRTDRHGKPAGIYTTPPTQMQIDETSTSYLIRNDENPIFKEFFLGTKYYVDGGDAGDDAHAGTSFAEPKKTIGAAITAAGSGNKTIIIRGAHDSFDGIYYESALLPGTGTDDTHRVTLVGYGTERPTIDGGGALVEIFTNSSVTNKYYTVQRLRIQNCRGTGLRLGNTGTKYDGYVYAIDIEAYQCCYDTVLHSPAEADGNAYWLNADHGWASHCTSHKTLGHGIKMGDGAAGGTIEWCSVYECGYWSGIVAQYGITNWSTQSGAHPSGIDVPADYGVETSNMIVRYNIVHDTLFYGIQLRSVTAFSCHHNEVYNTPRFSEVPGSYTLSVSGRPQVSIQGYPYGSGSFYGNCIHDAGSTLTGDDASCGLKIGGISDYTVLVYDNLIYANPYCEIYLYGYLDPAPTSRIVRIYNNTLYHTSASGANGCILSDWGWASNSAYCYNNIYVQTSTGPCVSINDGSIISDYNLFSFALGTLGDVSLGAHEVNSGTSTDPDFVSVPSGAYADGEGSLNASIPGVDLSSVFTVDANGFTKSAWDVGWLEYQTPSGGGSAVGSIAALVGAGMV